MSQDSEHNLLGHYSPAVFAASGIRLSRMKSLDAGESGAWLVTDRAEHPYILKVHPNPEYVDQFGFAEAATRRLRETGYPAPCHIARGTCTPGAWQLIEWLPGQSHQPLSGSTFQQMLALNGLQRNQALSVNVDWIGHMIASVLTGCDGYCQVETLRDYSSRTDALLQRIQRHAYVVNGLSVRNCDIVHYDFHPGNILVEGKSITGVIDWNGVRSGDAAFDLTTLLFYCHHEHRWRDRLIREILDRASVQLLRLYLGHMILRQVDWSIRHHDQATVEHYLQRAERILSEKSLT